MENGEPSSVCLYGKQFYILLRMITCILLSNEPLWELEIFSSEAPFEIYAYNT
jgi:hypothetical protein